MYMRRGRVRVAVGAWVLGGLHNKEAVVAVEGGRVGWSSPAPPCLFS